MSVKSELECYKQENEALKKELCSLREELEQVKQDRDGLHEAVLDSRRRISFLEGQVSAFEFCITRGVKRHVDNPCVE